MDVGFSINLRDEDGDIYNECILLHVRENTILKFTDVKELKGFALFINGCVGEIRDMGLAI